MRKTYYNIIGAVCMACGMTSCADFMEIKPTDQIILEDFWGEKTDVDNIVTGCYSALQAEDVIKRMIIWGEARSDNMQSGENINNDADLYNILKENLTANNKYTTYDLFYDVINRCNTVLKYAPGVAEIDPSYTEGDLKATIAEVSALRDLCYFYLIRTFRDVPYSEEAFTDDDQKMDVPATPFETVLGRLIEDLEKVKDDAVNRYPEDKPRFQTGRITKDAIYAMLSEMYLWKKDYDNCIKYADMVISSKKLYEEELRNRRGGRMSQNNSNQATIEARLNGYPLVYDKADKNDFGESYAEIFLDGSSKETIFELSFDNEPQTSGTKSNSAISSLYGNNNSRKGLLTISSTLLGDLKEPSGTLAFEAKDKSNYNDTRLFLNASVDEEAISKYVVRSLTINSSVTPMTASYGSALASDNNGSKWIIYRLPDIMLLEAEALCQQMQEGSDSAIIAANKPKLAKAFALVNAINKRAICNSVLVDKDTLKASDYNTKSLMEELVKRERQRELMFEGKRWYDLVRYSMREGNTNPVITAVTKRDDVNSQFAQNFFKKMDAIFWPYNIEEMKVNRNLVPNPVYGTGENTSYEKTK